jgi:hypothetical protein
MLPIWFEDISPEDVLRLVEDKISERKVLEYKQTLNIGGQDERAEFLADISSFANASGGDIVFGIADERDDGGRATGIPKEIAPLGIANPSAECARMEQIIESGIEPRIPVVQIKAVDMPNRGPVIVARIGKSWIAPHMVSYANRTRFYSRNGTGKMQLDVQQIGAAFALQRGLGERLRDWKSERIAKAIAGEGPARMEGSQVLLHFASASALMSDAVGLPRVFDTKGWGDAKKLISMTPMTSRYNADGLLFVLDNDARSSKQSYLQVFKDGKVEYGDTYQMNSEYQTEIPSALLEEAIAKAFANAVKLLSILKIEEPIFVSLSFVGMRGRRVAGPDYLRCSFDRDVILCPDVRLENLSESAPYPTTLLPLINSFWQAAGLVRSPYIAEDGTWNPL